MTAQDRAPEVRVFADAAAAVDVLLGEVRAALGRRARPLLGFATGGTFHPFFARFAAELQQGAIDERAFVATHLDEYLGFPPDRRGGMVHELVSQCPPFGSMLVHGTMVPVPHDGDPERLRAHEERLQRLGGLELQLLGIGRNGHLAFNEPGTAFELGFHRTDLAESTRQDARARFSPEEPPQRAATAGIASILAARRLVLCAFGAAKAPAVRRMLRDPVGVACPATALRRHGNSLVLLDRAAAADSGLDAAPAAG